jgi:hypothetical protein
MSKTYTLTEDALSRIGHIVADLLGGGVSGAEEWVVETIKEMAKERDDES